MHRPIYRSDLSSDDARRSREVSPEEFQEIASRGHSAYQKMLRNKQTTEGLHQHWGEIKDHAYEATRKPWGGATYNTRTGLPIRDEADIFSMTARPQGHESVSVKPDASREEFHAAMDHAKDKWGDHLAHRNHHLGVFHDADLGRIDIDPVVLLNNHKGVEEIGAYTHATGGAYHFKSGDGFWPPHISDEHKPLDKSSGLREDDSHERSPHLDPGAQVPAEDPEVRLGARRQEREQQGSAQGPQEGPAEVALHPKVDSDLDRLPRKVQETFHERVDFLRLGRRHTSTHPLHGPLKGWNGTSLSGQHRMVHRMNDGALEVLSVANHNEAYNLGARRAVIQTDAMGQAGPDYQGLHFKYFKNYSEVHPHPQWLDGHDKHDSRSFYGMMAFRPGEQQTVGTLEFSPLHYGEGDREVHVHGIKVEPEHQRRGVATALLNHLESLYPDTPINHGLRTQEGADLTQHFYSRPSEKAERPGRSRAYGEAPYEGGWTLGGNPYDPRTKKTSGVRESLEEIGRREHPNVDHYRSGGMGHIEGDESKSVVGFMPTHMLRGYEGNETWNEDKINQIHDDIKSGKGITNPLMMIYDHKNKWAYLGEGNHRLKGAVKADARTVPVRFVRGDASYQKKRMVGGPMHLESPWKGGLGEDYIPTDIHPHHFMKESKTAAEDYWINHRPGEPDEEEEGLAAPAHALDRVFPENVYTHPHYYHHSGVGGGRVFNETVRTIRRIRGNPEAPVTMYRSLPPEHAHKGFRTGDWVSLHHDYAKQHGLHATDPSKDWPIIKTTVPAKHLWNNGDSLDEFGYHGPPVRGEIHSYGGSESAAIVRGNHTASKEGYSEEDVRNEWNSKRRNSGCVSATDFVCRRMPAYRPHRITSYTEENEPYQHVVARNEEGHIIDLVPHLNSPAKQAARFTPHLRVFAPTCGMDHRLWTADEKLKPEVRSYILKSITQMWAGKYVDWALWAKVYFAGSEASEWTSENLEGNNDFDVLVGVDYERFWDCNSQIPKVSNQEITDEMNQGFRAFNGPVMITIDGVSTGPWDRTTYVNPNSYDIRAIKPYAAYDVGEDKWVVKPPHLPHWDLTKLAPSIQRVLRACDTLARDILKLPEPEKTQQGAALFDAWHSDRSRAFGPNGEGWYDIANLREKWLDQAGLWAQLVDCKHKFDEGLGAAPIDWSNNPRVAKLPKTQKCEFCKEQATKRLLWAEGMAYIPVCDEHEPKGRNVIEKDNKDEVVGVKEIAKTAVTDKWPPYLTEKPDEYGDVYPVNVSRSNVRGPVGTHEDAKALGWHGPLYHGTSKRRAAEIRRGGFRQPRLHDWEMGSAGTAEEVDFGNTHRTYFAETHDEAMDFARGNHGDNNAAVVQAYIHPDHVERDSGGGWMPSVQCRDAAKIMAIREPKGQKTAMAWEDQGDLPEGVKARPKAVKRAGFAGFVADSQWDRHTHNLPEGHPDRPDFVDDHLSHFVVAHSSYHKGDPEPIDMSRGVYATQSHVSQFHVNRYKANPDAHPWAHEGEDADVIAADKYPGSKHPMFVTHQGRLHVGEGHHRVAAALQTGRPLDGYHHDLDAEPVIKNANGQACETCHLHALVNAEAERHAEARTGSVRTPVPHQHVGLVESIRSALSDDLLKPQYRMREGRHPQAGHCYAASEAAYHMLGGKDAGWTPMNVKHEGDSHWFLRDKDGLNLDPTGDQFETPVPYHEGTGRGFLTKQPSKRAQTIIDRVRGNHA
jgi:ribosomal protein S18 acetylase RimI-like enzyme